MPGTSLSSQMQGVEEKNADRSVKAGASLEANADSLDAAERDFRAAEEENGRLIGSIMDGLRGGAPRGLASATSALRWVKSPRNDACAPVGAHAADQAGVAPLAAPEAPVGAD